MEAPKKAQRTGQTLFILQNDAAEQQPRSGFPTGRGTEDGHLKAHHDLQARPARPEKATRLGFGGSLSSPQTKEGGFNGQLDENKVLAMQVK
ncbi:hypothetical protein MKW98_028442 [Papaver atlanticum]|uniref:Uncharacterized protein n=1 Tax=Papaver atlanticum TaxID=357466 RepID=A0AAD4XXC3_9MAGN|nr:hypothetical protein MKW98_028442 [Papaver atlanticum]